MSTSLVTKLKSSPAMQNAHWQTFAPKASAISSLYSPLNRNGFIDCSAHHSQYNPSRVLQQHCGVESPQQSTSTMSDICSFLQRNLQISSQAKTGEFGLCAQGLGSLLNALPLQSDDVILTVSPLLLDPASVPYISPGIGLIPISPLRKHDYSLRFSLLNNYLQRYRRRIKGVLIANANQFNGKHYSQSELGQLFKWCIEHKLHFMVDETWSSQSCMDVCRQQHRGFATFYHSFYDISKMLCQPEADLSACVFTENDAIRNKLQKVEHENIAAIPQYLSADRTLVDAMWREHAAHIQRVRALVHQSLSAAQIPYYKAEHGPMVMVDLSAYLKKYMHQIRLLNLAEHRRLNDMEMLFALETNLYFIFLNELNISLVPGGSSGAQTAGSFGLAVDVFLHGEHERMIEDAIDRIHRVINDVDLFHYFQQMAMFRALNPF